MLFPQYPLEPVLSYHIVVKTFDNTMVIVLQQREAQVLLGQLREQDDQLYPQLYFELGL